MAAEVDMNGSLQNLIHPSKLMRNVRFSVKYELRLRCRSGIKWLFVWE